jgi:hypothetical protein
MERRNPRLETILAQAFLLVDPRTEMYYFDMAERDSLLKIASYPSRIAGIFRDSDTDSHNGCWLRLKEEKLDLALVDWYFSVQKSARADVILPPSPLLTGENLGDMSRLLWTINARMRSVVLEFSDSYPAFYVPFHSRLLDSSAGIDTVLNLVEAAAAFQRVFVFKIVWYSSLGRVEQRRRLARMLDRLDALKRANRDGFLTVWLDAGSEGYPLLFNGCDAYFEPLHGHVGYTRRMRADTETAAFGSYLNPRTREMMRWEDLQEFASTNQGYLPCDCKACEPFHGRVATAVIDSRTWNLARRVHNFNVRTLEVQTKLVPAIENGTLYEEWTRLLQSGNKNHLDLAPLTFQSGHPR